MIPDPKPSDPLSTPLGRIEAVLDEYRARLRPDGSDLVLLSLAGGQLRLRMTGAMSHCGLATRVLQMKLLWSVREQEPSVTVVELER